MLTPEFMKKNRVSLREIQGGDVLVKMKDYYLPREKSWVLDEVLDEFPDHQIVSIAYEPTNAMGDSRLVLWLRKRNV